MENEFGEKEFFIRAINCGRFMRFEVPTAEPVSQKQLIIHWIPTTGKAVYLQSKEKAKMLRSYAETGRLDPYFTKEQIEAAKQGKYPRTEFEGQMYSFPWDFHYFIPTNMGGREDPKNVRFVNNKTYYDFRRELLYPLETRMKDVSAKFEYCVFKMPAPPRVVTDVWYRQFYSLNQQAEKEFLKKREIYHSEAHITEIMVGDTVILKIQNHPFVHCPTRHVRVGEPIPNGREDFEQDEQLHHKLYRRDALVMKGINEIERSHMIKRFERPKRMRWQMHHILGLSLGGKNELENLMFVQAEVHKMFNATVEKPLQSFIEQHAGYPGKEVYIEMPVPMLAYKGKELPTKIPPIKQPSPKDKRVARRKLRRQSKCDLEILIEFYDYEREN